MDWSATRHDVSVEGRRVALVEMGSGGGTPLLCLHGVGNTWRFWMQTLPELSQTRRVLALDLPGFGDSESLGGRLTTSRLASHLFGLCDALGLERVALCGHSMGAVVALEAAGQQPVRVTRLAIVGGALLSVNEAYRKPLSSWLRQPRYNAEYLGRLFTAGIPAPNVVLDLVAGSPLLRRMFVGPYLASPDKFPPSLLRRLLTGVGRIGVWHALAEGFALDIVGAAGRVSCPTLVVNGACDEMSRVDDAKQLARLCERGELVVLPKTGHWPMVERPREFNSLLAEFLASD